MAELIDILHDLVQICCDGEKFYQYAAGKMQSEELREAVSAVGRVRGDLCRDLASLLAAHGERPSDKGTLYGRMHKLYADFRARLSGNPDEIYVDELEEAEDRLLHALEEAMLTVEPPAAREVLRRYMPTARDAHERMRELKRRKARKPPVAASADQEPKDSGSR
ncbi:MAG: PA2169 family four-helix-bundle protein [Rhodanobacteraceae bacterium]